MFFPDVVQAAASRFSSIRPALAEQPSAVLEGFGAAPRMAPAPESVQSKKRAARLNRAAATQTAKSLVLEADASTAATASQTDVIHSIAVERVVGSSDLMDVNFLELAVAVSRGVGRVRVPGGFGTGFLIGPGVMMTNHHVIAAASDALGSIFQLDYQDNASGQILPTHSFALEPKRLFVTDKDLDFSVIAVAPESDQRRPISDYPWMKLMAEIGKADVGDCVNIIQHPRGGLKQIAFRENKVIAIPQGQPQFLYYTTDTEPGSSGSPCCNDQWELIALHHSGVPEIDNQGRLLKKDHTIWKDTDDPALLSWIGNEGVRVSMLVAFLRSGNFGSEAADIIGQALTLRPPNPIELARSVTKPSAAVPAAGNGSGPAVSMTQPGSVTWSIPLNVTFSFGQLAAPQPRAPVDSAIAAGAVAPAPLDLPGEEVVVIDPDYHKRPGYDPNFLGVAVPLPRLSDKMKADTAKVLPEFRHNGNPYELAYYHYSVCMNAKRRTAWFSAANVDGAHRPDIGKRTGDKWYQDKRISTAAQLGQEAFEPGIDRGHLTRRQDTAWGKNAADALRSNNDTFHFTNCSLQASAFNQGKDRWQGLEQFLLEQHARKDKRQMVVITGPVFAPNDPIYRNGKMDYSVRCPIQFWKVCVLIREDGTPSATGFILGQEEISDLDGFEAAFDVVAAQIRIKDLEKRTGLDFGAVKDHDHFAAGKKPDGTLELEAGPLRPIRTGEDIVV